MSASESSLSQIISPAHDYPWSQLDNAIVFTDFTSHDTMFEMFQQRIFISGPSIPIENRTREPAKSIGAKLMDRLRGPLRAHPYIQLANRTYFNWMKRFIVFHNIDLLFHSSTSL